MDLIDILVAYSRDTGEDVQRYIDELSASKSIVRCRDCKFYQYGEILTDIKFCCRMKNDNGRTVRYNWSDDDYCSRGVRKGVSDD